ncbi:MAG: NAD-dependent epimerase/dehydratase family protein [Planctomycetota bacterium]
MSGRAVFVTGATGFVGTALARRLAAEGDEVHAFARPTSDRSGLAELPVRWYEGDLADGESVQRACEAFAQACAASGRQPFAVHSGALISYRTGDGEQARRVNVEGTRHLLDACQTHGVRRVVHVSSVVTVGHAPDAHVALDEEADFNGAELLVDYVTTKRAAEDFALSVSRQLDVVVVNPGAIFGPAPVLSNTSIFLRRVAEERVGPVAPPGSLAVVGVDDVAAGIFLALGRGRRGARYLLTESNLTHRELLTLAAAELGVRAPRATAPRALWRLVAAGAVAWDRLKPQEEATPQALRLLGAHFRFDARRAQRELGWTPRPFAEVLADTVRWLRERGAVAP